MIIEVLQQMYQCGSNKGINFLEKATLLPKLNSIIEWDFCKFPTKIVKVDGQEDKQEENREFLGTEPELKPGNCFLFKGQVIAVDSIDRLILLFSDTGYNALERIWNDYIKVELNMNFNDFNTENVIWNAVENDKEVDEFDGDFKAPYSIYNIWKERFVSGRGFLEKNMKIKISMNSDNFIWPIDLILMDWSVKYKTKQLENDEVELAVKECLTWFYNKYKRIK